MRKLALILLQCAVTFWTFAQDSTQRHCAFADGLGIRVGIGHSAIRDEFISDEKYSGSLPYVGLSWSRFHGAYGYRLIFEFERSASVKNHNISAQITEATFDLEYLYPVGNFLLLSNDLALLVGPSAEFFLHFRNQNMASGGSSLFNALSFSSLLSAAAKAEAYYPLNDVFQIDFGARLSILSLGARMINPEKKDVSAVKVLTVLSSIRLSTEIAVRYRIANPLTLALVYQFKYTRIAGWDLFLSGSDTFIAAITYDL
jgi:hypothetical protein